MSPQSSLCIGSQVGSDVESSSSVINDRCYRRVSCSNSELARDANISFFQSSQDRALDQSYGAYRISNPLGQEDDGYHFQLRKRKCYSLNDEDSSSSFVPCVTADFLSGIFEDLAQVHNSAQSDTYSGSVPNPLDSLPSDSHLVDSDSDIFSNRPCKRSKGLSRCSKSYALLLPHETADETLRIPATATNQEDSEIDDRCGDTTCAITHPVSTDWKAAQIANQVFQDSFCDAHITFPTLPATVSASSCSSNNLTQTSVQAAQVLETLNTDPSDVEGNEHGDTYGWFVEMDEEHVHQRLSAVAAATESCKAIAASTQDANLTFRTAPVENSVTVELDSEVEWAKAADTVDDVLGEIFF